MNTIRCFFLSVCESIQPNTNSS